ncbi:MAG: LPS export ABC transporter ATP-binding protein [Firmicutes bacterium]|nr:LPS export ABC transporter ATP-binding protein [Bacillota bacterium]MDH7494393.1 LPS export ABC transporter ATP-binding protein [Bacillota bacterium]
MSIVCRDLAKSYGRRRVVQGVSLEVEQGEVVGLLGPNGAGKTTTFYMIVGLEAAQGGSITLAGRDITRLPMHRRARLGLGYLAQEPSIFRKMTVEENILAVLELMGLSCAARRDRLEGLLDELAIGHIRKQMGYTLSGGERRRVEIARALATSPKFILLDEPFTGVDPIAVADIQEIIGRFRRQGLGVLITDHNVRDTLSIVDRAYIMHQGKILVSGDAESIAEDPVARKFYLGERFTL